MNIHHLELFYYVAKHGGIAAAVRNMPYGIQQPAVSGQIARLEEALGAKLFNRRPFSLLPAGVELFELVKPCYTTMFPSYYDGFADAFLFSDSNFTRQREPTPRDCCRQEKSIWRLR